jgi:hypothetical protein
VGAGGRFGHLNLQAPILLGRDGLETRVGTGPRHIYHEAWWPIESEAVILFHFLRALHNHPLEIGGDGYLGDSIGCGGTMDTGESGYEDRSEEGKQNGSWQKGHRTGSGTCTAEGL